MENNGLIILDSECLRVIPSLLRSANFISPFFVIRR